MAASYHIPVGTQSSRSLSAVAVAALLLVVTPGAAQAQPSAERHKWWLSDKVKAEVGLTADQSNDIEAIFQSMLPRLRSEKEDLDRREQELSRLMMDAPGDEARVTQAVEQVESVRAAANKTRTLMLFKMYRVLSPDQRVKLKTFHDRLLRERRGGREPGSRQP